MIVLIELTEAPSGQSFYLNSDYIVTIWPVSQSTSNLLLDTGKILTVSKSAPDLAALVNSCPQGNAS
jgi:hypothetical protein